MNAFSQMPRVLLPLLLFSLVTNLAVLVSPVFMMQVLDRVIPSGNIATLVLLGAVALAALILQAAVEGTRDICLGRLSRWSERTGTAAAMAPGRADPQGLVETVAGFSRFLGGSGVLAALNMPWIPVFVIALSLIHPGFVLLLAAMVLLCALARMMATHLTTADEDAARTLERRERETLDHAASFAERTGVAMVEQNLRQRFAGLQETRHRLLDRCQKTLSGSVTFANLVRSSGQILALGLGAYLVTIDQISAGGMIAGSIILSKGYASIETSIGQFPAIRKAAHDYRQLRETGDTAQTARTEIPALSGTLRAEGLIVPRGGGAPPRLDRVSFKLEAGECMVIVGSSGSGKSTLLRALAGVDPAPIGSVFLDQSEIRGLSRHALCMNIGFLPQRADLVGGTISENIACFEEPVDDGRIVEAAKSAGVHGLISALPDSYDTDLAAAPFLLSAGQSQRVALARAIYNTPAYLFLDEPNALLDANGEKALAQTLMRMKEAGTTIVMVLHRSGLMGLADKVLRLENGRMADFGNRAEVLARLGVGHREIDLPLLVTSLQDLRDWIAAQFTRSSDDEFCEKAQIVGGELLQIALSNGPKDIQRSARFVFRFIDDTHCEMSMIEDLPSQIEAKMTTVRAKVRKANGGAADLPGDEAALAMIDRLSDRFEVRCVDDATHVSVALTCAPTASVAERRLN